MKRNNRLCVPVNGSTLAVHIGSRIKLRRLLMGLSQEALAERIGVSFQQVQKVERGQNKCSGDWFVMLSQALDVPVSFFFDDMPTATSGGPVPGITTPASPDVADLTRREILELARAFDRIKDEKVRKSVLELTKSLGRAEVA